MKSRDSQKSKLYKAEQDTNRHRPEFEFESFEAAAAWAKQVGRSKWLRRIFPNRPNLFIRPKHHGMATGLDSGRIRLPRWAWNKVIILHEVAHVMVGEKHRHGREFARAMLMIVRHFLGVPYFKEMRLAYRSHGVKFHRARIARAAACARVITPAAREGLAKFRINRLNERRKDLQERLDVIRCKIGNFAVGEGPMPLVDHFAFKAGFVTCGRMCQVFDTMRPLVVDGVTVPATRQSWTRWEEYVSCPECLQALILVVDQRLAHYAQTDGCGCVEDKWENAPVVTASGHVVERAVCWKNKGTAENHRKILLRLFPDREIRITAYNDISGRVWCVEWKTQQREKVNE